MMAKNPNDRFATPAEVAAALEPFAARANLLRLTGHAGPPPVRAGGSSVTGARVAPPSSQPALQPPIQARRALWAGIAAAAAVVVLAVGLVAWLNRGSRDSDKAAPGGLTGGRSATTPAVASATNPIKVGVLHSRTGTMAISERAVIDATLLAIDELNEKGGVLGRRVEPVVEDGASDWPTFAERARSEERRVGKECRL